ncbi:MAG: trypsin-like peptidase domain-containing protein [Clostridia bacterium]|nr:trypsin-like peptidase domain-containing protein [Clostridia bacterium]
MKNWTKILSIALACVMLGSGIGLLTRTASAQETDTEVTQTVIVTSPFTQAISEVKDSVVGVRNYQTVRYSNYGNSYDWSDYFGFGQWPFGNGGRNYGNGNGGQNQPTTQEVLAGTGSGVVIAEHYVLTNYHVVEDASSLKVTVAVDGQEEPDTFNAEVVATDENLDVAVIYAPKLNLKPVTLGDSDTLQVGDWAICIGNPLGEQFSGTVTTGIISALNRSISSSGYDKYGRKETTTNTMIQTDAAINNGNSGGGMFSVTGELMGIPTIKYSGTAYSGATIDGIGMCIPINAAKPLINDVLSGVIATPAFTGDEDTTAAASSNRDMTGRPRLGVTITNLNAFSAAVLNGSIPNGVYVDSVEAHSPAEAGGMQAGDIIVDVDDTIVSSVSQLQSIIAEHGEGDTLKIKVYRVPGMTDLAGNANADFPDGEYVDLEVTLAIIDAIQQ